jgi:hypothetical protein
MAYNDYPEAAWGGNEGIDWAKRTVENIDAEKLNNGI